MIAMRERKRKRIAILSSFVLGNATHHPVKASLSHVYDHIINKACYASLWNYEFIFNTSSGFSDDDLRSRPWLHFGGWSRIPHLEAALDRLNPDDWILYADLDYVIKDMSRPLSSFIAQFDLYDLDPHVLVPTDSHGDYVFSDFAVMVRNSDFGRSVLRHWRDFAMGICPRGNYKGDDNLQWYHTDQPGLWYALIKAHMEFYPNDVLPSSHPHCDLTSGYIAEEDTGGPMMMISDYFIKNGYVLGNSETDLATMQKNQSIIWSRNRQGSRPGLGVQMNWAPQVDAQPFAFAIHQKGVERWPEEMRNELEVCKKVHGCTVDINYGTGEVFPLCN